MSDILFEQRGCVGLITLNRTKALNALSLDMVHEMTRLLDLWREDDSIKAVIVISASEKAFCAGGDIRKVWEGRDNPPFEFFWHEYRLNRAIFRYPKPYISLINGIVMGGGVGISMHGQYIVLGENTTFAMPEVGIGFFPDVGGSYLLPRMKGKSGIYCALTAARLKQGDCLQFGLATHTINSSHFDAIIQRIAAGEPVDRVLDPLHEAATPSLSDEDRALIEDCFSGDTVAKILAALKERDMDFAAETLKLIEVKSPTSVHVTLGQLQRGAKLDFEDCMRLDYRIVKHILLGEDFYEGVRATLVDKDGAPQWNPAQFDAVDASYVDSHFDPLSDQELIFE